MTIEIITALIIQLCPNLEAINPKYIIQGEQVDCMEYYTNDIINNPFNYKEMAAYDKSK